MIARRTQVVLIAAMLVGASLMAVALRPAAAGAQGSSVVLGAGPAAAASCPLNCLVEARVTGFQTSIGSIRNPFVSPADGNITTWSIKLGKPKKPDRRAFNREFGPPKARIAILKRRSGRSKPPRYKLLRQSPIENLGPFFGSTTTFALDTPLAIKRGQVVALTIKTWAPALAVGQGKASRWLSSRRATKKRGGCTDDEGRTNVDAGAPQVKKGTRRPYGCSYRTSRLLYSANLVQD